MAAVPNAQRRRAVHYDSGLNMTPLVDVVMVILIFLMLAGSFAGRSWYLTTNLPVVRGGAGGVAAGDPGDEPLDITVRSRTGGRGFVARAGDIEVAGDGGRLCALLETKRLQYHAAGTPADKIQVVIRPEGDVRYEDLAGVFEAVLLARYEKVAFAAAAP